MAEEKLRCNDKDMQVRAQRGMTAGNSPLASDMNYSCSWGGVGGGVVSPPASLCQLSSLLMCSTSVELDSFHQEKIEKICPGLFVEDLEATREECSRRARPLFDAACFDM